MSDTASTRKQLKAKVDIVLRGVHDVSNQLKLLSVIPNQPTDAWRCATSCSYRFELTLYHAEVVQEQYEGLTASGEGAGS